MLRYAMIKTIFNNVLLLVYRWAARPMTSAPTPTPFGTANTMTPKQGLTTEFKKRKV